MTLILQKAFLHLGHPLQNANPLSGQRKFHVEFQAFAGPAWVEPLAQPKLKENRKASVFREIANATGKRDRLALPLNLTTY
jgi:hypothetical protein